MQLQMEYQRAMLQALRDMVIQLRPRRDPDAPFVEAAEWRRWYLAGLRSGRGARCHSGGSSVAKLMPTSITLARRLAFRIVRLVDGIAPVGKPSAPSSSLGSLPRSHKSRGR